MLARPYHIRKPESLSGCYRAHLRCASAVGIVLSDRASRDMSAILHMSSLTHKNAGHPMFAFTLLCMYYLQFMLLTDRFML